MKKGSCTAIFKPENLFVIRDGRVKILDFGLAKLVRRQPTSDHSTLTAASGTEPGVVMGTVGYMSPEQVRGNVADHRADIFALGAILYEMLAGKRAFQKPTSAETMSAILNEDPPGVSRLAASPLALQSVVHRCLEKNPEQRFQSASDLAFALEALSDSGSSPAIRPFRAIALWRRALGRGVEVTKPADAAVSITPSPVRSRNRYVKTTAAVMGFLVVLATLMGALSVIQRSRAEGERKAAITGIEPLVDTGRFVDVWRIAQPALRRWPNDPTLRQLQGATTMTVTIATDPPGADVAFKALDDVKGDWIQLGRSPLRDVRAPLGMLRWRITKSGFEPIEARLEVGTPAAAIGHPDFNARPIRLRPVGSEFARMVFVPSSADDGVHLTDCWIDRTEVTNRDFKAFVDHRRIRGRALLDRLAATRQKPGDFSRSNRTARSFDLGARNVS